MLVGAAKVKEFITGISGCFDQRVVKSQTTGATATHRPGTTLTCFSIDQGDRFVRALIVTVRLEEPVDGWILLR